MVVPGVILIGVGIAYYRLTQDTADGNFGSPQRGDDAKSRASSGSFSTVARDPRVWALFIIYGACFGVELTINNVAALYFKDQFSLSLTTAGIIAGLFGLMNVFARTLGGVLGDKAGIRWGLRGRVWLLGLVLLGEGLMLILFSRMSVLPLAITTLVVFSLFVQMSEGATFSVVPFVNKNALGSVSGIVGAGGNAGAVAAGFLFRSDAISAQTAFLMLGIGVTLTATLAVGVRFSAQDEETAKNDLESRLRGDGAEPRLRTA
jgi:NNP family nitrate/nitrite transporter-like MFS transporter